MPLNPTHEDILMQTRNIGDSIIYTDTHPDRILTVIGEDAFGYDPDLNTIAVASNAPAGWTTTLVGSSTVTRPDAGGGLLLTTGVTENDGVNTQAGAAVYLPSPASTGANSLYFYAKLQVSEAAQSDLFVGLAITDTDILGNLPKRIGFRSVDGSAALGFEYEGTAETTVEGLHTLVAATDVELEFFYDHVNAVVRVYIDGTLKGTFTPGANLPDVAVKPSLHYLAGSVGAKTALVSRLKVVQIGR